MLRVVLAAGWDLGPTRRFIGGQGQWWPIAFQRGERVRADVVTPNLPLVVLFAQERPNQATYRADIARIDMTPASFAAAYSVAIRVTPEKLSGH